MLAVMLVSDSHCFLFVLGVCTEQHPTGPVHFCVQTSQNLVYIQPCNSHALYLLGSSQFNKYENSSPGEAATKLLHDARTSFESSIELQGKPAEGEVPELVAGGVLFLASILWWPYVLKSHAKYESMCWIS